MHLPVARPVSEAREADEKRGESVSGSEAPPSLAAFLPQGEDAGDDNKLYSTAKSSLRSVADQEDDRPSLPSLAFTFALDCLDLALLILGMYADVKVVMDMNDWMGFRGRLEGPLTTTAHTGPSADLKLERIYLIVTIAAAGFNAAVLSLFTILKSGIKLLARCLGKDKESEEQLAARTPSSPPPAPTLMQSPSLVLNAFSGDVAGSGMTDEQKQRIQAMQPVTMEAARCFVDLNLTLTKILVFGIILNKLAFYGMYCKRASDTSFAEITSVFKAEIGLNSAGQPCASDPFAANIKTAVVIALVTIFYGPTWYQAKASGSKSLALALLLIPGSIISTFVCMLPVIASNLVFNTLQWQSAQYGHFELDHLQITALVAFYLATSAALLGIFAVAFATNHFVEKYVEQDESLDAGVHRGFFSTLRYGAAKVPIAGLFFMAFASTIANAVAQTFISAAPLSLYVVVDSKTRYPDAWNAWFTVDYACAIAAIVLGTLSLAVLLWKCCCGGCCGEKVAAEAEAEEPTAMRLDSEGAKSREENV